MTFPHGATVLVVDDETRARADAIGISRVVSKSEYADLPDIIRALD